MNRNSSPHARSLRRASAVVAASVAMLIFAGTAGPAMAASPAAAWSLHSLAMPTNFTATDNSRCLSDVSNGAQWPACDAYRVTARAAGAQAMDGSPITLSDALPAGVSVQQISFLWDGSGAQAAGFTNFDLGPFLCDPVAVTCTLPTSAFGDPPVQPDDTLTMIIYVTVNDPSQAGSATNQATVSGGNAAIVATSEQNTIGESTPPFGVQSLTNEITGPDGQPDTQAADHPYELTTRIGVNSVIKPELDGNAGGSPFAPSGIEDLKDVAVDLPLGFLGSAQAAPTCTLARMSSTDSCPRDTVVGHIVTEPFSQPTAHINGPIFNLVPEHGVAAEFGYFDLIHNAHVLYANVVPTPNGYVLRTTAADIPQVSLANIVTTFFGNPAVKDGSGNTPVPLFTNPSSCNGQPLTTAVHVDSWQHPGRMSADGTPDLSDPNWASSSTTSPAVTGCNLLQFQASMSLQPDTTVADSPSGVHVDIRVPQTTDPNTLATPPLKDASVTLPPGFTVDPSSADGLGACSPSQISLGSAASPTCPDSSKIGSVQLTTPLLPGTLTGSVYLASEFDNPFHSLLAGYIVVDDPTTGVVIKIPGNLTPDPSTGQITGVFDNNPQFPFSELKLDFKGGSRGVLATPESCGTFTSNSAFSPWSFPDTGPASTPSDSFQISSGCVSGFHPSLTAGTQNAQAGRFSPFVLSLSRADTDENFQGLAVKLPAGMLAKLAGVSQCSEQQLASISSQPGTGANELASPSCPANSQVGTVTTGAGVGPTPFFLGGKAYLTGPYKGAPYGLAVVVPAVAGPLDLGTVVVRQALYVDPTTAQVTDVSDQFPAILDGIPLRIRRVDVNLDRPNFTINPTSCDPMSVGAIATSTQGTPAGLSSRFQVGGCAALGFSPKLGIALTGKGQTHSNTHPTLTATLTQPFGQANIKSAKVALPLSLALDPNNSQHVCSYDVAQAVHGGAVNCPASTIVGQASAVTPLLSQPLTGKVYLVQGIRFGKNGQRIRTLPSLLIPLRGQIALDLRAQSSVNGGQQLVTTFSTIPDAAVSKFTLQINGGQKGILVITGRGQTICGTPQIANANFGAQSGKAESPDVTLSTPCGKPAGLQHSSVKRDTVRVTVHIPGPGKLTASGQWLKSQTKLFGHAQTVILSLHLTNSGVKNLDRKGKLETQAILNWTPSGGGTHPMQTRMLTIRR